MTINILGTPYTILVKKYDEEESFARFSISGYCDGVLKQIVLCDMTTYKDWERETKESCSLMQKQTLRHEIVHAFLNESGLQANANEAGGAWARNEEMVDWFAIQGPKIYVAWREAEAALGGGGDG